MIDFDKLQMVADRAIEIGAEKEQLFSAEEVISVFSRLRQVEKDAARYRWVRSASVTELSEFCNMIRPNRDSFVDDSVRRTGDNK